MSQNRTVFPGIGPDERDPKGGQRSRSGNYSRAREGRSSATVFPGMENGQGRGAKPVRQTRKERTNRPLVGFLFSVSRTGFGEYWPLYIGSNTIGRSPKCDVVLPEGTVSEGHAELVVRMMKNPAKLDASLSDQRSSHGTMLNGVSVPSTQPLECKNGDVITVGESYELYLILIDTKSLGLGLAENFIDSSVDETDGMVFVDVDDDNVEERENEDFPPRFTKVKPDDLPPTYDGTIGVDGGNANGPRRGGTEMW